MNMSEKSKPKKKSRKPKIYEQLNGKHVVSEDGSQVKIGGTIFKRTVLPSSATRARNNAETLPDLNEDDELSQETGIQDAQ